MAVIGIDDTDSRERGMCTTYLAARIGDELDARERFLIRLNPAVEHKTRGNAALALAVDADTDRAFEFARREVAAAAETADPDTQPGLVVAPGGPDEVPDDVAAFARAAVRDHLDLDRALDLIDARGYRSAEWAGGRGRIGALAAVGATRAVEEWTYEHIAYRPPERRGRPREVDRDSVFAAAEAAYPDVWDTVDRAEGEAVCVPHTPGPVLYGVRGEAPDAVRAVADRIDSEPPERAALFRTNQGTDAHLRAGTVGGLREGRAYRVTGTVGADPETRRGGHVFFPLQGDDAEVRCVAFEPTKRFRERVRALRAGDRITACGEVAEGTLKLEKFAARDLVTVERVVPSCPECGRSMESAGAGQGYRCRACGTSRADRAEREVERDLEPGWYEVPPCARRHIAKPLVRGGFDAPVHPER